MLGAGLTGLGTWTAYVASQPYASEYLLAPQLGWTYLGAPIALVAGVLFIVGGVRVHRCLEMQATQHRVSVAPTRLRGGWGGQLHDSA